jgi:hypothetical protein
MQNWRPQDPASLQIYRTSRYGQQKRSGVPFLRFRRRQTTIHSYSICIAGLGRLMLALGLHIIGSRLHPKARFLLNIALYSGNDKKSAVFISCCKYNAL